ncbi:MAG TPA: hypothetical protein PLN05_14440 [Pyrinomonadaceae bacterium]|nr:hypothetical protein [Chloracidobacterium sp.]HRJ89443.1 hypothetical protein [Pyrinomonadaceae bacterium]HRK51622.1 hypothetical protein [Pyrinomonadaceae bacterium]
MRSVRFILVITLFTVMNTLVSAQAPQKPAAKGDSKTGVLGHAADGRYRNDLFGLELKYPADWHVVDQETTAAVLDIGTDFLKGDNQRSNNELESSIKQEVVLFHLTRKPMGSIGNCVFMLAVQKQPSPKVLPKMVAEATKSLLVNSPNLKVARDTRTAMITGRQFAMIDFEMTVGEQKVIILYYVTVTKGYALSYSLTFADTADADRLALENIARSITFDKK